MPNAIEDKDAIRELMARYCFLVDGKQYDEWADLFTEDGSFEVTSLFRFEGRAAIRSFADGIPLNDRGLPGFKHCTMNQIIEVAGDHATAQCYFLLVQDGSPLRVDVAGRYEDALVKRRGRWQFQSRTAYFDYHSLPLPSEE